MRTLGYVLSSLALLALASCSTSGDAASSSYATTLTVTDAQAVGVVGDRDLSLAEAIGLANGSVQVDALSSAERRHVNGAPGRDSADRIRFRVPGGAVRFPLQVQVRPEMAFAVLTSTSLLPALIGNDGDGIYGEGVRFTNGADDAADTVNTPALFNHAPLGGTALTVHSSNFSIEGVTFERFISSVSFSPAAGSAGLSNVRLIDNKFHNAGGVSFAAVSTSGERSALRAILISANEFLGPRLFDDEYPSKFHSAISFVGADARVAASAASGVAASLEDLNVIDNTIREFGGGVQAQPLQTLFVANAGARLSGLRIVGNQISLASDAPDPAIYLWGAVSVGGQVSNVEVSDVLVQNNTVSGNGSVIFVTGVEALLGGLGPATNIHMRGFRILDNHVRAITACERGITTIATFPEMNGAIATGNSFNDVTVSGNTVENCQMGIVATPVLNVGAPGASTGNAMQSLTFERNTLNGVETGIVVAGGALIAETVDGSAGVRDNTVAGVAIRENVVDASRAGILIAGGIADGQAAGEVADNRVEQLDIQANVIRGDRRAPVCLIVADFVQGASATATGNSVVGDAPDCERR